jgi:hypothetical protein
LPHENEILKRIEAEMEIDPTTEYITDGYPWKPCRERMTCNRDQVQKLQSKTES